VLLPFQNEPQWSNPLLALILGPNDGGVQRGDRDDAGDNEARPTEKGTGFAQPTIDPTALGGTTSIRHPSSDTFSADAERADLDGMEIMQADDGRLGLTDAGATPPDDWAADTGGANTPEGHK
jgi:hypothetical protein